MSWIDRVSDALRISHRRTLLVILGALAGLVILAALATRQDRLPVAVALAFVILAMLVSFKWPLAALLAFAALIPIEEVVLIDGLGTLSRAAGVLFALAYGLPRLRHLQFDAMPTAGWAYVAWALASMAWAIAPDTAWAQLSTLLQLVIIATLIANFVVERPSIIRPILWAYSISATVAALVGIESYLAAGLSGMRATAFQDQDPAQFAAVLLPAFVFGIHEVLNGDRRTIGAVIAILTTIGVVVSGTRGVWLGAAVVLLLLLPQLRPWRRIGAVAAIVGLIVIVYQVPGVADLVAQRTGNALSTGGAGRTDIWSVGLTIFASSPVLGVGFANFPVAFTPSLVQLADLSTVLTEFGRGPHNLVIGTLGELGPIGILLLAMFVGPLVLRRGWGPEAAAIQATLASLLVTCLFLDIFANRKQVWLIIGISAGLAYLARRAAAAAPNTPSDSEPSQGWVDSGSGGGIANAIRPGRRSRAKSSGPVAPERRVKITDGG
jgi:exopolysaccharide production protein ExoQ